MKREKALEILHQHMKNQNLRRHCYAVEAVMRALARKLKIKNEKLKIDEEKWGLVGLIHDSDYEETKDNSEKHTLLAVEWLKEAGETDPEIISAILSHNYGHTGQPASPNARFAARRASLGGNPPKNKLEWALYCCDELTGFIVAVALVHPNKKLSEVSVDSVLKKMPDKSFAAAVKREQIKMCEEKLGIPLPEFVKICLEAMQGINKDLGL